MDKYVLVIRNLTAIPYAGEKSDDVVREPRRTGCSDAANAPVACHHFRVEIGREPRYLRQVSSPVRPWSGTMVAFNMSFFGRIVRPINGSLDRAGIGHGS